MYSISLTRCPAMGTKLWQVLPRQQRIIQQQFEHQLWVVPLNGLPCTGGHWGKAGGEKGELQRVLILSRWWAPLVMQRHSQRATAMKRVACATTKMLHKRPTSRSKQRNLLLSHFKSSLLSPFLSHLPQSLLHPFLTLNLCVCVYGQLRVTQIRKYFA